MSGLIQEILRKPTFKDIVRGHLKGVTTGSGRELVKDLIWQDFEVLFGILGTMPAMVNACVGGIAQMAHEIHAKFSPRMLKGFIGSILSDIDRAEIKDCGDTVMAMARDVLAESPELVAFILEQGPAYIARGINSGARSINDICLKNPELISNFLKQVIDCLDKPALNDAVLNVADAVLDQKLGIFTLAGGLIRRRGTKLFKRFKPAA